LHLPKKELVAYISKFKNDFDDEKLAVQIPAELLGGKFMLMKKVEVS